MRTVRSAFIGLLLSDWGAVKDVWAVHPRNANSSTDVATGCVGSSASCKMAMSRSIRYPRSSPGRSPRTMLFSLMSRCKIPIVVRYACPGAPISTLSQSLQRKRETYLTAHRATPVQSHAHPRSTSPVASTPRQRWSAHGSRYSVSRFGHQEIP